MKRIPEAPSVLQATADYLEHEVLPTLSGYHRFQTRISVNLLRTLCREAELAPTHTAAEQQRLQALLGRSGDVDTLNADLADAIGRGTLPLDTPGLVQHLRLTLHEALTINSPHWAPPEQDP